MTRAMLLCAGLSTRLGDLSSQRPKPLLPVAGVPIVRYGIANLVAHGITDIVINLHHKGELIREALGDGSDFGCNISYSVEEEILGTGGGVKKALPLLDPDGTDEPFLTLNGKLIFDLDVTAVLAAFKADPGIMGMMVVRRVDNATEWGAIQVEEGEKPRIRNALGEGKHMFCGVQVTRRSVMERLPDGQCCWLRQGYLPWMKEGGEVAAFEVSKDAYFAEHSTPERYLAGNRDVMSASLTNPPAPVTGVDGSVDVGAATVDQMVRVCQGATIGAGAHLGPYTVVGHGAEVAAGARLANTVVWSGARAEGTLENCIVTPGGVFPVS